MENHVKTESATWPDNFTEADKFVRSLLWEAKSHRAVNHPFLINLARGNFPDAEGAIRDLAWHYQAYRDRFLSFLTGTISQLEDQRHRDLLICNLAEEKGTISAKDALLLKDHGIRPEWAEGVSHTDLFTDFLNGLGVDCAFRKSNSRRDEAEIWADLLLMVCRTGTSAEAVGALGLGTECIVKTVYRYIQEAVTNHTRVKAEDRVFFDLHSVLDDEHGEILLGISRDLAGNSKNRQDLRRGMQKALHLRAGFFDAMESKVRMKNYC